jgi:hypothetical protein
VWAEINDDLYKPFDAPIGRAAWKSMVPGASLQLSCNREGFNNRTKVGWAAVRIGLLGNEQNDCGTPDSRMGLGTGGSVCGMNPNHAAGNAAGCGGDNGNKNIPAFGYLLVR